ncbi:uncharacterized protein LOC135194811 [Vanessa tameamea]|uniref:Uncharacterized protein LOC135194811 n=1 Tax=Vanessa tameamea TaxID=334116 RepID=A0ABM4AZY3_VANTA
MNNIFLMFLATSSSESEDEYLQYRSFRSNSYRRTQFHPGLENPFIYYAQVKPKRLNRRSRENEKYNSNCFVKAFRWYTQEHVPFKKTNSTNNVINKDLKGFATWLDEKYNEYQDTNRIEKTQCILNQSSTLELISGAEIYDNKVPGSKKFPILRSPWYKHRKSSSKREETDFTVKSNQSIKIILKPKNLSRATSECCQRSDLQNNAIISNTSALHMKLRPTSRSLTSVLKEKEIYIIPFDVLQDTSHEELKHKVDEINTNERKKLRQIFPMKSIRTVENKKRIDVYCQCSHTSFDNNTSELEKNKLNTCLCYKRKSEYEVVRKIAVIPISQPNTKDHEPPVSTFVTDSVQTSDYSINLENDLTRKKPVFVKLLCPHKLDVKD